MLRVPIWEFGECLERLQENYGRIDLTDDLDPEAERQLCRLVEQETGVRRCSPRIPARRRVPSILRLGIGEGRE